MILYEHHVEHITGPTRGATITRAEVLADAMAEKGWTFTGAKSGRTADGVFTIDLTYQRRAQE